MTNVQEWLDQNYPPNNGKRKTTQQSTRLKNRKVINHPSKKSQVIK